MAKFTIHTPLAHLNAVSLFTADQDVRCYLNGLGISLGHIVATNGHCLAAIPYGTALSNADCPEIIIPNDALKKFLKKFTYKQKRLPTRDEIERNNNDKSKFTFNVLDVRIEFDNDTNKGSLVCNGEHEFFTAIDEHFPKWKQIIPASDVTEYHGFFNWDYVALFAEASRILGDYQIGRAILKENDTSAAKVILPQCMDFIGVIMPMRY